MLTKQPSWRRRLATLDRRQPVRPRERQRDTEWIGLVLFSFVEEKSLCMVRDRTGSHSITSFMCGCTLS